MITHFSMFAARFSAVVSRRVPKGLGSARANPAVPGLHGNGATRWTTKDPRGAMLLSMFRGRWAMKNAEVSEL